MSATPIEILRIVKGREGLEGALHIAFQNSRQHGEWFMPTPELLGVIEDLMDEEILDRFLSLSDETWVLRNYARWLGPYVELVA